MTSFKKRAYGNPVLLISSVLLFSSAFYMAYKHYYQPYALKRQLMKQGELIRPLLEGSTKGGRQN